MSSMVRTAALRRPLEDGLFLVLPLLVTLDVLYWTVHGSNVSAVDFHGAYWPAAVRVLHGLSPYAGPGSTPARGGEPFVYPAAAAWALAPFGWLSQALGDRIFTLLAMAAPLLTLRALR